MKYQSRVSGPLLDRIDIQIEVPPLPARQLPLMAPGEPSSAIRERIVRARAVQEARYRGLAAVHTNADVGSRYLCDACRFSTADKERLVRLIERLGLSARAYDKVLRVARTMADLDGSESVRENDILGALSYRKMDEQDSAFWV